MFCSDFLISLGKFEKRKYIRLKSKSEKGEYVEIEKNKWHNISRDPGRSVTMVTSNRDWTFYQIPVPAKIPI